MHKEESARKEAAMKASHIRKQRDHADVPLWLLHHSGRTGQLRRRRRRPSLTVEESELEIELGKHFGAAGPPRDQPPRSA
jgi:hypothetical protein